MIIACYKSIRSIDRTNDLELPAIPAKLDPYEVAFLRGGANEVTRVAIASLIQRGLLQIVEKRIMLTKTKKIARGRKPLANELRPIEERVLTWSGFPATPQSIFQPGGLSSSLKNPCEQYEANLIENNLLAPEEMKEAAVRLWWIGSAVILGLGGYKLWAALTKGHHNIAFLCILGVLGVVFLAIACFALLPRVSRLGKAYLEQLKLAYGGLKDRARIGGELDLAADIAGEPGKRDPAKAAMAYSDGLLLVGIFGMTALAGSPLAEVSTMFAQAASSSGGGCGAGCGGGGGGCGGGGGGCGGCGGGG